MNAGWDLADGIWIVSAVADSGRNKTEGFTYAVAVTDFDIFCQELVYFPYF
jgi:hypothetical protein